MVWISPVFTHCRSTGVVQLIYQTCVPGSDLSGSRAHRDVSTQIFLKASRQQLGLATLLTLTFNVFLRGDRQGESLEDYDNYVFIDGKTSINQEDSEV